jgi:hypothetical protein
LVVSTGSGGSGGGTLPLTPANRLSGADPDVSDYPPIDGGASPVNPFYWNIPNTLQTLGDVTFTATFTLDPAAPESLFSPTTSGGTPDQLGSGRNVSETGPYAFLHSNNWGINVPFNLGAPGPLKPGEAKRNSIRYSLGRSYCVICGVLQFAGFVLNAVYSSVNSGNDAASPGWGWNMGPSYAKISKVTQDSITSTQMGPTP